MKIVAINGSYRGEKGLTSAFIKLIFSGAREAGAECEEIPLSKYRINHCLACDQCHTSDHYLQCVYHDRDDAADIFKKIAAADLVIYATPVYVFGISGLLKIFLERLYSTCNVYQLKATQSGLFFHHVNREICSKPFVSLICCDSIENLAPRNTREYFRIFGSFMEAKQAGELVRNCVRLFEAGKDGTAAQDSFPKIGRVNEAYKQAGRELAKFGFIRRKTIRQANQEIIPVPFFGLIKRLRLLKPIFVLKAGELLPHIVKG